MTVQQFSADEVAVSAIRMLAIDTVNKAKSGHPGAPMGMAPMAHILFSKHFIADPTDSKWINRDRVVLSNGHASALLYVMLHLSGYPLSLDDLKSFRQLHSKTPGHPESFKTEGVEVTTGPLGQGFANAVGLAIASANLGATYNRDGFSLVSNKTYVFCGDGCLQEGVASEAASLAGHLRLKDLIVLYDDNHITIDGDTGNSFTEDVEKRFEAYGWQVLSVTNADLDLAGIDTAVGLAKKSDRPTLIKMRTTIGYGSRVQGTHGVHGTPLLADDINEIKTKLGVDSSQTFAVPQEVYDIYRSTVKARGQSAHAAWSESFSSYAETYPAEHAEFSRRIQGELPSGWKDLLPSYKLDDTAVGGRKYSEHVLNALLPSFPELIGGSADLTSSNYTRVAGAEDFQPPQLGIGSYKGKYIRYGVREHAMGAIMNGLSAYGCFLPFAGTFLNFVSYAAGAVRLSALSGHQIIWVATHDSIGLGEDGPTHQPIETAVWLRATPNLNLWRPADGNETSAAYLVALESKHTPSVLCLSRQNLPQLPGSSIEAASKGGYIVENPSNAKLVIVSTGSEVSIALEASRELTKGGIPTRTVSLPCWEIFNRQSEEYRLSVLSADLPVLSVEAYSSVAGSGNYCATGWSAYSHSHVGIETFGDSAPPAVLYKHFGITVENVIEKGRKLLEFYEQAGVKPISPLLFRRI